jgi:hypothetical protein
LEFAKQRFEQQQDLRDRYGAFANALLKDIADLHFSSESIFSFICRRETLLEYLHQSEFREAIDCGEFKTLLLFDEVRGVTAQIPELAAVSLSHRLSASLLQRLDKDRTGAIDFFVNMCSRLPLGDVIGAHALVEAAIQRGGLPVDVLTALLNRPPQKKGFEPGAHLRIVLSDRLVDVDVDPSGQLIVIAPDGQCPRLEIDDDETMITDMMPWMVLSYFAAMPIKAINENSELVGRLDAHVLETVAACPVVLRNPLPGIPDSLMTHRIPGASVVCHKEGIVEPITLALYHAATSGPERGEYLVERALASGSLSFLLRLYIALNMVSHLVGQARQRWARGLVENQLTPRIRDTPIYHRD